MSDGLTHVGEHEAHRVPAAGDTGDGGDQQEDPVLYSLQEPGETGGAEPGSQQGLSLHSDEKCHRPAQGEIYTETHQGHHPQTSETTSTVQSNVLSDLFLSFQTPKIAGNLFKGES